MNFPTAPISRLLIAAARGLETPPPLTVSEWADRERWLSSEDSSEHGKWDTARAEFQRGIMDACSDPMLADVAVKASSQVGKSQILNNVVGYHVDHDPCPMMMVQPTLDMAEAYSKERLAPMFRDTPALLGKVKDARSRDSGNTLRSKRFPGGGLALVGANSPASLSSRPIRVVLFDEVSRYEASAGTEGDPVNLGSKRTQTFWNAKRIYTSTPATEGLCRIDDLWEKSDKRRFFVACPHCAAQQYLKFEQIGYVEGPHTFTEAGDKIRHAISAEYRCESCSGAWTQVQLFAACARGQWKTTAPFTGIAGFHIWEGYSPWSSLLQIANAWLAAQGKPEQLKTFRNTVLGETYRQSGESPDAERLFERREDYAPRIVPRGGLFLTAGVDVQNDRIEVHVKAWGRGKQSWLVDYFVLPGRPFEALVWVALTGALNNTYEHACGASMPIVRMAIDTGHATNEVYAWVRSQGAGRVMAVKGTGSMDGAIVGSPSPVDVNVAGKKIKRGAKVWPVAVSPLKFELYGWLALSRNEDGSYPDGYTHVSREQSLEWFRQLTAEQWQVQNVKGKGYRKGEWVKVRERNEVLDTAIYARAAASQVGIDRWDERTWKALESNFGPMEDDIEVECEVEETADVEHAPVVTAKPLTLEVGSPQPTGPRPGPPRSQPISRNPYPSARSNWMNR